MSTAPGIHKYENFVCACVSLNSKFINFRDFTYLKPKCCYFLPENRKDLIAVEHTVCGIMTIRG